ncbi:MAG: HD domain-containing protein [Clostridia bacterium]|nr:HD domain-containing protein [Clostridia bacterium]
MQDQRIILPSAVAELLLRLNQSGYSAFVVGGCVRDSSLGLSPHDWDICTSALPDEIRGVFRNERLIETGIRHGTLTVVLDHTPYEITTYRVDGSYSDHRHPDEVVFVGDVCEDLSRRDFTINAMAYSDEDGLVDPFGGQEDLRSRLIRCVGDPEKRFEEDALRILRALRFASVFDFQIDPATDAALRKLAPTLNRVAAERIREELVKLLCGAGVGRILRAYPEVLAEFLPEIRPMIGYQQQNHHHLYDLWEHTVRAVEGVPADPVLRVTMLLHDTGKPAVRTTDDMGEGHYRGHQLASAQIAEKALTRLRFDNQSRDRIILLVRYHDIPLRNENGSVNTDQAFLLRRLNQFGEENVRALFRIHRADRMATGYSTPEKEELRYRTRVAALNQLLSGNPCYSLRTLAVDGNDLKRAGYRGKEIGEKLQCLLEAVMDGLVDNQREALLQYLSSPRAAT